MKNYFNKIVYEKLAKLIEKQTKATKEYILDEKIRSSRGEYSHQILFDKFMTGLHAKIIRTSNACAYFQSLLKGEFNYFLYLLFIIQHI